MPAEHRSRDCNMHHEDTQGALLLFGWWSMGAAGDDGLLFFFFFCTHTYGAFLHCAPPLHQLEVRDDDDGDDGRSGHARVLLLLTRVGRAGGSNARGRRRLALPSPFFISGLLPTRSTRLGSSVGRSYKASRRSPRSSRTHACTSTWFSLAGLVRHLRA